MRQFLDEAKRVLKANSVTANGNEEVANFLAALMQDRGMKVNLQQVTHSLDGYSKRQFNLIGILGDPLVDRKTKKGLLLTTHLDTVDPGVTRAWDQNGGNPFQLVQQEGSLYALGAASGKLDILAQVHAAEKFREKKLKHPIYIVGTCGGEMSLFGAKYLIKSLALNPKFVLVTEPSGLKLMTAHKRQSVYRVQLGYQMVERDARGFNRRIQLRSIGKIAHAGSPDRGRNSILQFVEFLSGAISHGFDLRFTQLSGGGMVNQVPDQAQVEFFLTSHQLEDFKRYFREVLMSEGKEDAFQIEMGGLGEAGIRFLPDGVFPALTEIVGLFAGVGAQFSPSNGDHQESDRGTVNLGAIRQNAGGIELSFDLRSSPQQDVVAMETAISEGFAAISSRFPQFNIRGQKERVTPAFEAQLDGEFYKLASEALTDAEIPLGNVKKATVSDASLYAQAGYEVLGFGAGPAVGSVYEPNESARMDAFMEASRFYEKLIERVCL